MSQYFFPRSQHAPPLSLGTLGTLAPSWLIQIAFPVLPFSHQRYAPKRATKRSIVLLLIVLQTNGLACLWILICSSSRPRPSLPPFNPACYRRRRA